MTHKSHFFRKRPKTGFLPIGDVPDARRSHLFHPELVPVTTEPQFPWRGFDCEDAACAWHLASLSHNVYHNEDRAEASAAAIGWKLETRVEHDGVRADLLQRDDDILLCCCGTRPDEIRNLRHDVDAGLVNHPKGGKMHRGFAAAWQTLRNELLRLPPPTLSTGHSLGGALAILAASEFPINGTIVLGCPRVGDSRFAQSIDEGTVMRYQVTADVVCHLPPKRLGFEDVGRLAFIAEGQRKFEVPYQERARFRKQAQLQFAKRLPWLNPSALWFRELADHAIHGYCYHLATIIEQET
ncbi:MAG: hypothetical protein AAGJ81_12615 [Verrucomicrobiota bacterium]